MSQKSVVTLLSSLTVLGLLSGCGNNADVDVKMDGTANMGSQSLPDGWPDDAPAYPGSTVSYSTSMNHPQTGKPGMAVVLSTRDTVSSASTYYKTELASRGWLVETAIEAGGTSIFSATKEGRLLSVIIVVAEGQTTITMAIEK